MQYEILVDNIDRLEKKLLSIRNKCEKYGCSFNYERVGETFKEIKDADGNISMAKYIIVEASGTAIINDWKFVASVEHTEKGNVFKKSIEVCDVEIPSKYYDTMPVCEHCKSNRYRKYTYIIQNITSGEFKQVGKSCLKDFTCGMDAENITRYISYFDELIKGEYIESSGNFTKHYKTFEILCYAFETVKHFGYTPSGSWNRSTATQCLDYYRIKEQGSYGVYEKKCKEEMASVNFNAHSPDTENMVKSALEWLENQPENTDYIHNLKVACSLEYITASMLGICVSLTIAYHKNLEKEDKRKKLEEKRSAEKINSKHIGEVGKRIEVYVKQVAVITSWNTEWGTTAIYKLVDEDGNVFTWKTSSYLDTEYSGKIKATVKAHNEYNGILQTELTRCKMV
jgi:hypothetical protein